MRKKNSLYFMKSHKIEGIGAYKYDMRITDLLSDENLIVKKPLSC